MTEIQHSVTNVNSCIFVIIPVRKKQLMNTYLMASFGIAFDRKDFDVEILFGNVELVSQLARRYVYGMNAMSKHLVCFGPRRTGHAHSLVFRTAMRNDTWFPSSTATAFLKSPSTRN